MGNADVGSEFMVEQGGSLRVKQTAKLGQPVQHLRIALTLVPCFHVECVNIAYYHVHASNVCITNAYFAFISHTEATDKTFSGD